LHESAHAAAALHLGLDVPAMHVRPDGSGTTIAPDPQDRAYGQLFIALAGREAEQVFGFERDEQGMRTDFTMANDAADRLADGDRVGASHLMQHCRQRVAAFVRDRAPTIYRLATALHQRGSLTGDDIRSVLRDDETMAAIPTPTGTMYRRDGGLSPPGHR